MTEESKNHNSRSTSHSTKKFAISTRSKKFICIKAVWAFFLSLQFFDDYLNQNLCSQIEDLWHYYESSYLYAAEI